MNISDNISKHIVQRQRLVDIDRLHILLLRIWFFSNVANWETNICGLKKCPLRCFRRTSITALSPFQVDKMHVAVVLTQTVTIALFQS